MTQPLEAGRWGVTYLSHFPGVRMSCYVTVFSKNLGSGAADFRMFGLQQVHYRAKCTLWEFPCELCKIRCVACVFNKEAKTVSMQISASRWCRKMRYNGIFFLKYLHQYKSEQKTTSTHLPSFATFYIYNRKWLWTSVIFMSFAAVVL